MGKIKDFAKQILSDVSSSKEFHLHYDGKNRVLKNLVDLRIELESMSDAEFSHHVNDSRNDFATWVDKSVGDDKLSHDLSLTSSKEDMIELIKKRIDFAVSVIEKENKKIIHEELTKLKQLEKKSKSSPKLEAELESLEKGLRQVSKNVSVEEKLLNDEIEDLEIRPWHEYQGIHPHARIIEFIFGLVLGLVIGLFFARVLFM